MKHYLLILAGCGMFMTAAAKSPASPPLRLKGIEPMKTQPMSLSSRQVSESSLRLGDTECKSSLPMANASFVPQARVVANGMHFIPTEEDFALFYVYDGNLDGNSYSFQDTRDNQYSSYQGRFISSGGGGSVRQDDWLFFPVAEINDAEKFWEVTFDIRLSSSWGAAVNFEVFAGTSPSPEAMTIPVIAKTDVSSEDFVTYSDIFSVPKAGDYYVGIHNISEPSSYGFFLKELSLVESERSATGPLPVDNLAVTPSEQGALSAEVSFSLPTEDIAGNKLPSGTILTAHAFVQSAPEGITLTGTPGERLSCLLPTEQGWNNVHVNCTVGSNTSKDEVRHIFTGIDIPGPVCDFKISTGADPYRIVLEWTPPATGQNGYYVDPTGKDTDYYLTVGTDTPFGTYWQVYDHLGTGVIGAELAVDEGVPTGFYKMGVVAQTVGGQGDFFPSGIVQAGQPNALPVIDDFYGGETHYYSYNIADDANLQYGDAAGISMIRPSTIGVENASDFALLIDSTQPTIARLNLPRFHTVDSDEVVVRISVYTDASSPEAINFYCDAYGIEPILLGTTGNNKSGWQEISCTLPAKLLGQDWVDVYADIKFTDAEQRFLIDKFSFKKPVEHELGFISVLGPESVLMGEKATWNIVMRNAGTSVEQAPVVKCTVAKGDKILLQEPALLISSSTIAADEISIYQIEFNTGSDSSGKLSVSAELEYDDADKSNNTCSWMLDVTTGNKVFVEDLRSVREASGDIRLDWTAPELAPNGSFEYAVPFAVGDKIGPFINIDNDKENRSYFSMWAYPNMGVPAGFQIWNIDDIHTYLREAGLQDDYSSYDGVCVATAICPYSGLEADDWLISPELKSGTDFSFAMCPISTYYGAEAVEILTSKGSTDPKDFTLLADASIEPEYGTSREWKVYYYTLPDDATRFAIRYRGQALGIMVDAIDMDSEEPDSQITGYTIRRNGNVIEDNAPALTTYIDKSDVSDGTVYTVQPVITDFDGTSWKGEESNTATVGASGTDTVDCEVVEVAGLRGAIIIRGAQGSRAEVVAADGMRCFRGVLSGEQTIPLNAGVYIVRVGDLTTKVIVK